MRFLACTLVAAALVIAVPAAAANAAARLRVTPGQVAPGGTVRVSGSAAGGCASRDRVTVLSRAFPGTHRFAGVPAITARTTAAGHFARTVRIPRTRKPGRYTVTARCGGGNLGIVRYLRVLAPGMTARAVTIRSHAAFVRASIAFTGGTPKATDPRLADPDPGDGTARLAIVHNRVGTTAPTAHRSGLRVTVEQASGRLRIRLAAAAHRFKYVAYRVAGQRVLIDVYRSRPPSGGAARPGRAGSCLSIAQHADSGGTIHASGTAHGIFENQFTLAVRNAAGRVIGHRTVAYGTTAPRWASTVSYSVSADQPGTLEAVALSPRDGALTCLAQIGVPLAAPLAPPPR
jgi:hypothetical protein